ncbi:DUF4396 domain-containing protein [Mycobacterium sp. 852002-40037_SCH5390672]|uniref:DUF4396 domain-containing protein n=1 Tax=Mycobacterium sp. 852002-40037_SCH5390672 TaxID=1834089 RepID=UPI0008053B90|nr:DUF4396 domain-containing protein [Mycobacterium sp. 852002-40037_SCH5390672]OBB99232.1 hypothetical protein A5782_23490 [Mycobacterium sp. 852002-40037_SCH5390672]
MAEPPPWLTALSWAALALAVGSAIVIMIDIYARGYRQRMRIMEAVWPVTALYFGPVAVWMYWRYGRPNSSRWLQQRGLDQAPDKPKWATIAIGVSHCGAGCTLGDIIAEFAIFALGLKLLGRALLPEYLGDYVAALALGVVFQYFAIAPMRGMGFRDGMVAAAKADVLSLTAFEVGLFGWMAVMAFVLFPSPPLHPDTPTYWFLMQIGMIVGFATAWPANVWLIRRGIKEAM